MITGTKQNISTMALASLITNEFLDYSDEEVTHALYMTRGFWISGVNKQEALNTYFAKNRTVTPYQQISEKAGIPVEFLCYMINIV